MNALKTSIGLWKPVQFKRPQADLVANRDWRFSKDLKHLTLTTLGSLIKCDYSIPNYFKKYLELPHKFGTSKLLSTGKHWYFHTSCTVSVPNFNYHKDTNNIVGIDRGLRFLTTLLMTVINILNLPVDLVL